MSKQTAVDLFHDRVNELIAGAKSINSNSIAKIWLECKAMEREQIEHAHLFGLIHSLEKEATQQAAEYYKEEANK